MTNSDIIKRNNVRLFGYGEHTLLLAHGLGCDQTMWNHIIPSLQTKYRVVVFDYVGSGDSDSSQYDFDRYSTLEGYKNDLLEVCSALNIRKASFLGHSVSAMIGALGAISNPEYFRDLVMICPSARYMDDPPSYKGGFSETTINELVRVINTDFINWANSFVPFAFKNPDQPEPENEIIKKFCSMDSEKALNFARATFYCDSRKELSKIPVRSLVIQCKDDPIVPVSAGEFVANEIKDSVLKIVSVSGHFPHISHPLLTANCIIDFLEGKESGEESDLPPGLAFM